MCVCARPLAAHPLGYYYCFIIVVGRFSCTVLVYERERDFSPSLVSVRERSEEVKSGARVCMCKGKQSDDKALDRKQPETVHHSSTNV